MRPQPFAHRRHLLWFAAAAGLLVVTVFASLRFGALSLDTATVWSAIWNYDHADHGQIVGRELRVHRTVIGSLAGACLAVAGALTQGVTRNPLGAPGILGINAGAAFAVVGAIYLVGISSPGGYVWFAFGGALGATLLVYAIASAGAGGATPIKLALAGAIISALAGSWTAALLLLDVATLDQARFWLAGSIGGRGTAEVMLLFPIVGIALVAALLIGRQVNALSMGAHVAAGLGQRVAVTRTVAGTLVVALAGSAVALAGPIAFVGLAVPHKFASRQGVQVTRTLALLCQAITENVLTERTDVGSRQLDSRRAHRDQLPTAVRQRWLCTLG